MKKIQKSYLMVKKMKVFLLNQENDKNTLLHFLSLLFNIALEVAARTISSEETAYKLERKK